MKRVLIVIAILVVASITAGFIQSNQAVSPVDVYVTVNEYTLEMSRTNFPAGVPIHFIFEHAGQIIHEAVLEKAGEVDVPLELEGEEAEVEDIQPGATVSADWTIDEAGQYQLACHIPGHYEGGMVSVFFVRSGGPLVSMFFEYLPWIIGALVVILVIGAVAAFISRRRQTRDSSMP